MTIISDHKNEIQFFRNHLPCPWILKMIRQDKRFNLPVYIFMGRQKIFYYLNVGWHSIYIIINSNYIVHYV